MANSAGELARELEERERIGLDEVLLLMKSYDVEILGVLYNFITDSFNVRKINPTPSRETVDDFLRNYFARCLQDNPVGEWADSRYSAGWDIANYLKRQWDSFGATEKNDWENWLGHIYKGGDCSLRLAIETAVLEHLFSNIKIRKYFSKWISDPELTAAYYNSKF